MVAHPVATITIGKLKILPKTGISSTVPVSTNMGVAMTRILAALVVILGLVVGYEFWGADALGTPHLQKASVTRIVRLDGLWFKVPANSNPSDTVDGSQDGQYLRFTGSNGGDCLSTNEVRGCSGLAFLEGQPEYYIFSFDSISFELGSTQVEKVAIYTGRILFREAGDLTTSHRCAVEVYYPWGRADRRMMLSDFEGDAGAGTCGPLIGTYDLRN